MVMRRTLVIRSILALALLLALAACGRQLAPADPSLAPPADPDLQPLAAEELFISENTVKNHIRNMLEKLQMKSRMEAAMYAVRSNLLDDPV